MRICQRDYANEDMSKNMLTRVRQGEYAKEIMLIKYVNENMSKRICQQEYAKLIYQRENAYESMTKKFYQNNYANKRVMPKRLQERVVIYELECQLANKR